ncbi:Protein kinase C terminal domain [Musa troglodytarum]|uniref:Protein kinase C terminal domain n=1 Tax=Musa troglodytarum TaxID=320322 RepID=A0A9E7G582_9LILI|nr:Protein kinase C terminal domain [Musa troglodytarum]
MAVEEGNQAAGVDVKGDGRRERDGVVRLEARQVHGRATELAGRDVAATEEGDQAASIDIEGDGRSKREREEGRDGVMLPSKDVNFVGYTYKNFEIVNDHEVLGIGAELRKKSNKPKRPTIKSLFDMDMAAAPNQPVQGSFLKLLPTQMEVPEGAESSSHSSSSSLDQSQSRYR